MRAVGTPQGPCVGPQELAAGRIHEGTDADVEAVEVGHAQIERGAGVLGEGGAACLIVHEVGLVRNEDRRQPEPQDVVEGVVAGRAYGEVEGREVAADRKALQPADMRPDIEVVVGDHPACDHCLRTADAFQARKYHLRELRRVARGAGSELHKDRDYVRIEAELAACLFARQQVALLEQAYGIDHDHAVARRRRCPAIAFGRELARLEHEIEQRCARKEPGIVLFGPPHAAPHPHQPDICARDARLEHARIGVRGVQHHDGWSVVLEQLVDPRREPAVPQLVRVAGVGRK